MNNGIKGNPIILASASPRRSLLLTQADIAFEVIPSRAAEINDSDANPARLVEINALAKAEEVAERFPNRTVLGADTVVAYGGKVFGKPKDLADAKRMLKILAGNTHQVFTGVAIVEKFGEYTCGESIKRAVEHACSNVTFKKLEDFQIVEYLEKVEVLDKAGAYAAQECGEMIIEKIAGDFDNVMGLPCKLVRKMLEEFIAAPTV